MAGDKEKCRFLILYGSQTGQAEAITKELEGKCREKGLHPERHCLSMVDKKFSLERESVAVLVCSTTGDGEPPDTATKFWRRIHRRTVKPDHLSKQRIAMLGLGDSNYLRFCNCGKTMYARLKEIGVGDFIPAAWADEAAGLETVVDPWMDDVIAALLSHFQLQPSTNGDSSPLSNGTHSFLNSDRSEDALPIRNDVEVGLTPIPSDRTGADSKTNGVSESEVNGISKSDEAIVSTASRCDLPVQPPGDVGELKLPPLSAPYICLSPATLENGTVKSEFVAPMYPMQASPTYTLPVTSSRCLNGVKAKKQVYLMEVNAQNAPELVCQPGDTIGVVCENPEYLINWLFRRLGVKGTGMIKLELLEDSKKSLPPFLPPSPVTLRELFTKHLELRSVPKKAFLRMLAEYTADKDERAALLWLSSRQGGADYTRYIIQGRTWILQLLFDFESCSPPIERLIELLPRLNPRPYSICSSDHLQSVKRCQRRLRFAFSLAELAPLGSLRRSGMCTGWLYNKIDVTMKPNKEAAGGGRQGNFAVRRFNEYLSDEMIEPVDFSVALKNLDSLALSNDSSVIQITVYRRNPTRFRMLPENCATPMLLIGPGVGVAPFIGFLEERAALKLENPDRELGECWLFFGCGNEREYIFREELERFADTGIISHLIVSFSRPLPKVANHSDSDSNSMNTAPIEKGRYVQDRLRDHASSVIPLLLGEREGQEAATVYVCGDAANMSKDVFSTLKDLVAVYTGKTEAESQALLMKMKVDSKYLEDVWA